MMAELKPSKPFSNGTEYEIFLDNFCYRCKKHKEREDGFCAFIEEGGCPIENAMEDARFDISLFPCNEIVQVYENGEIKHWHVCKKFGTNDVALMSAYKHLIEEG